MNKINYQKISDKIINEAVKQGRTPTLLLHACCAPCSSYVLEYLSQYFSITVLFFNPNISPHDEYLKRAHELERLVSEMEFKNQVKVIISDYDYSVFENIAKGNEDLPEGGARCFKCYRLRLEEAAAYAKANGFDYFTTTLSISPLKNSTKLNEIGKEVSEKYGVDYFYSDFKKREGYKRSIILSKEHNLYRQNYCGCVYSKMQSEKKEAPE